MGVRLRSEAGTYYGDVWKIEIIDNSYASTVIDFKTNLRDAQLKYDGTSKDRLKRIRTTEFKFTLLVENSDHVAFWSAMSGQQEGRFFVGLYYRTSTSPDAWELHFFGHLVMDETYLENTNAAQFIELSASDGLFRLKEQEFKSDVVGFDYFGNALADYKGDPTEYYSDFATLLSMIYECLQGVGIMDLYGSSEDFLWINVDWYEAQMPDMTKAPFEYARIKHEVFTKRNDNGEYLTFKRSEVLENILTAFNATIEYKKGVYIIESVQNKGLSSKTYFSYDKEANLNSDQVLSPIYSITYPPTNNYYALSGGKFGYLQPARQACVIFGYDLTSYGFTPDIWDQDNNTLVSLGFAYVETEETNLDITCYIRFDISYTTVVGDVPDDVLNTKAHVFFGVTIKFGSYYYITEVIEDTFTSGPLTYTSYRYEDKWSSVAGVFLVRSVLTEVKNLVANAGFIPVRIITPPFRKILDGGGLPVYAIGASDELSLAFDFVKMADPNNYNIDFYPSVPLSSEWEAYFTLEYWQVTDMFISVYYVNESPESIRAVKLCGLHNINNSLSIEESTLVLDGYINGNNRMEIWTGPVDGYLPSTKSWAVGALTGGSELDDLLINELIAGQPTSLVRYLGAFRGMLDTRYNISYDGKTFVPFFLTYQLYERIWDGEFYEYVDTPQTITISSSTIKATPDGNLSVSTGNSSAGGDAPGATYYPFEYSGAGSRTIDFTGIPLPDPSTMTNGQLNILCNIFRNGVRIWYGNKRQIDQFIIDYANNDIILGRSLGADESIKGYIILNA